MNFAPLATVLASSIVFALGGCSSQQLYSAGQNWQKTECRRLPTSEQERCLSSAAMSYEEYQRQAAAARAGS